MAGSDDTQDDELDACSTDADLSPRLAEVQARHALDAYPEVRVAGVVFACLEEVEHRWRILASDYDTPQEGRNGLTHIFLKSAAQTSDEAEEEELRAAAELLNWERHDELTVNGRRYRVGRIERAVRMGPDGPEPPRSSDPASPPGAAWRQVPDRSLGFIDEIAISGTAAAVTRYWMRNRTPNCPTEEMKHDAGRALDTHPRLVLIPATFMVAEQIDGDWRPAVGGTNPTPQAARDNLADHFRVTIPGPDNPDPYFARAAVHMGMKSPGPAACQHYADAADLIDREHRNDIHVADRHFRIVRVEQLLRLGADGPEPPRPSDPDGPPAADYQP
jgi:uncharacterized protein DUF5954